MSSAIVRVMGGDRIKHLNEINRVFYETVALDFSATRQCAWVGWQQIIPHLPHRSPLRVLDIGCGNGRFGVFLQENTSQAIDYIALDNNAQLLAEARANLAMCPNVTARFLLYDIFDLPSLGTYDVIVLFGVLHHVPDTDQRRRIVSVLAQWVALNGILCFTAWRFLSHERLRRRIVPWNLACTREEGDYLLAWHRGNRAVRYCHDITETEHQDIVTASALLELERYQADGYGQEMNRYSILKHCRSNSIN